MYPASYEEIFFFRCLLTFSVGAFFSIFCASAEISYIEILYWWHGYVNTLWLTYEWMNDWIIEWMDLNANEMERGRESESEGTDKSLIKHQTSWFIKYEVELLIYEK